MTFSFSYPLTLIENVRKQFCGAKVIEESCLSFSLYFYSSVAVHFYIKNLHAFSSFLVTLSY